MSEEPDDVDQKLQALQKQLELSIAQLKEGSVLSEDPTEQWEADSQEWKRNDLNLQSIELNLQHRKQYARSLFFLLVFWLIALLVAVFFQAFGAWGFKLSDAVLIALLSTSTVNIVGLYMVVAKYIFPGP
jgi:hypothetical protein